MTNVVSLQCRKRPGTRPVYVAIRRLRTRWVLQVLDHRGFHSLAISGVEARALVRAYKQNVGSENRILIDFLNGEIGAGSVGLRARDEPPSKQIDDNRRSRR